MPMIFGHGAAAILGTTMGLLSPGKNIVVILPDSGERYFISVLFEGIV